MEFNLRAADRGFSGEGWHSAVHDQGFLLGHFRDNRAAGDDGKLPGGVCWEVCRRWIRRRKGLDGGWSDEALNEIFGLQVPEGRWVPVMNEGIMRELVAAHVDKSSWSKANSAVDGLRITRHQERSPALHSREQLLKIIHDRPGLYIFAFEQKGGGGHAIAFDTGNGGIHFMDPNSGEFWIDAPSHEDWASFKAWYKSLYEAVYKDDFEKGDRHLTKYE